MERRVVSMFEIMVEEVSTVLGHATVSGKCKNKNDFTSTLTDVNGTQYKAALPLIKHIIPPEIDYVTLELMGVSNPNAIIGQTLRSVAQ